MEILYALVGYLAATALPFLAFASPLVTIDYDGYVPVNTTQNHAIMKKGLGNFVETSAQDGAPMKHVSDDIIIEARQAAIIVPVVLVIVDIMVTVGLSLWWISEDNPKREAYTKGSISQLMTRYNKYNWVICHSPYDYEFDGVEGTDYGYTHHELKISFGRTIGYDLFWATSGTFYNDGDGGFINWAYNGNITGTDFGGMTVHFGKIS